MISPEGAKKLMDNYKKITMDQDVTTEKTKKELTQTDILNAEINHLQTAIKLDQKEIEARTTAIYYNKKRLKVAEEQLKVIEAASKEDQS
jgi:hypothetical protein